MLHKLYEITFDAKPKAEALYFKPTRDIVAENTCFQLKPGDTVDLLTYFNAFSLKKWLKYTGLKQLAVRGTVEGRASIEAFGLNDTKNEIPLLKTEVSGDFELNIPFQTQEMTLLGLKITAIDGFSVLSNFAYYGEFPQWKQQNIGVAITTYKREEYVLKTIDMLQRFAEANPWLSIVVVDNGNTLEEKDDYHLRLLHNANFGGSGGFSRGIIENMRNPLMDYMLLMDDDIELEITALERTGSVLSALKPEYRESFFSGAMLNIDEPTRQIERTAIWGGLRSAPHGVNDPLDKRESLLKGENIPFVKNTYGSWWYCAIPVCSIRKMGLPLPVFIKGDDLEYGIRNGQEVLSLNGIGVWHEPFFKKYSTVTVYYWIRNGLMLDIIHDVYGRFGITALCLARFGRNLLRDKIHFRMSCEAIKDFGRGLDVLVQTPSDVKHAEISRMGTDYSIIAMTVSTLAAIIRIFFGYTGLRNSYKNFIRKNLITPDFWLRFLGVEQ